MKDLDFDELDRAVSSLIGGSSTTPTPAPKTEEEKTLTIAPTVADNTQPPFETLSQVAQEVEKAPAAAKPLASKRSSGRFMDVVHPSSDMKTPTPVSRQGITITPSENLQAPVSPPPLASSNLTDTPKATPAPVREQETEVSSTKVVSGDAPTSDWPDPLDFHNFTKADESTTPAASKVTEEPKEELSVEATVVEDAPKVEQPTKPVESMQEQPASPAPKEVEPLESPFIADAQVEKRPLGAFSREAQATPADTTKSDLNSPEVSEGKELDVQSIDEAPIETETSIEESSVTDTQLPAESEALPEELRSNLLSIEADTTGEEKSKEPAVDGAETMTPTTQVPASPDAETAPVIGSIPQQYKEATTTPEPEVHSMYDTDAYHQPLKHPVKKKSGWMVVVWVLLLLVVGAGAGAAIYFVVLPLL